MQPILSRDIPLSQYAAQALAFVLDQHEYTIIPDQVRVQSGEHAGWLLHYDNAAQGLHVEARFDGDQHAGILWLIRMRTRTWECIFDTFDRFVGVDAVGIPRQIPTRF